MPANIFIAGKYLVLNGITGNAGDKNAVASITVSVNVPDLATAFTLAASSSAVAAAVGIGGLLCTDRPLTQDADGEFTIHFVFEGFNSEVSFEQAQNQLQVAFEPEERQDPVETHPKFFGPEGLKDKYKYLPDEGKFALEVSGADSKSAALAKKSSVAAPGNPMFGVDSWDNIGGTFTRSYACTTPPPNLYQNIGILVDYPPDAEKIHLPHFKNRKWLKLAPSVQSGEKGSGSAIRIVERYRLTGILRGKPTAADLLYGEAQLT